MNTSYGSLARAGLLGGLAFLAGCCAEEPSSGGTDLSVIDDQPPQGSAVAGAVVFTGSGGVQIDLSVIDPEEPGATTAGEITAWAGSRSTTTGPPLPTKADPPTSTPIAQTTYWNLRRMNGNLNPWAPGVIERSYDSGHDQYWVFVQLTMQRQGGGDPIVLAYRHEWNIPDDSSMELEDFLKL